jgi:WD40 repeat protein
VRLWGVGRDSRRNSSLSVARKPPPPFSCVRTGNATACTNTPEQALPAGAKFPVAVAFSRGGDTLAAGDDSTVRVWDLQTRGQRPRPLRTGNEIWPFAFSPDGRTLATAGFGGKVRLWDLRTRKRVGRLRGHLADVYALAFSPDGRILATVGADKAMRLWNGRGLERRLQS